jgi:glucosamine--fructose-6-phosphate aminotransferase (isomerizing)
MCGISAVIGNNAPLKAILLTLNQLERGTEGCGIAYICNDKLKVIKEPCHPLEFFDMHLNELKENSKIAICHNRLPSAGSVKYENTHPFIDCNNYFALIHNGHAFLYENRKLLIENGHKISGETDSEVLTHLLEELYKEHKDMVKALKELTKNYLSGNIIVLTKDGKLYLAKSGYNNLHLAIAKNEIYIASSLNAIRKALKSLDIRKYKVKEIKNNTVVEIKKLKIKFYKIRKPIIQWIKKFYPDYYYDSYYENLFSNYFEI